MQRLRKYRQFAARCLQEARSTTDPRLKAFWAEMAQEWQACRQLITTMSDAAYAAVRRDGGLGAAGGGAGGAATWGKVLSLFPNGFVRRPNRTRHRGRIGI